MSNEELVALIQSGERERLPELWEQVKGFAAHQARRMMILTDGHGGVAFDDLYDSGYIALAAAVEGYDAAQGMAFIGWYAYALKTAFAEAGGYRSKKQTRDPINTAGNLDTPLTDEDDYTLGDAVADPAAAYDLEEAERRTYNEQLHKALDTAIDRLPADNAAVIRSIYFDGKTLQEIAAERGVSVQLIGQQKRTGIERLRRADCRNRLREYIGERTPWNWHSGLHVTEQIAIERERLAAQYLPGGT